MPRMTGLFRSRPPVRAMPWANDVSRWPLIRAPRRPDMARADAARRARSEPRWIVAALWGAAAVFAAVTLLGAVAKVFGPSLLAWRIVHVGLVATGALLAFVLARRETSRAWGLVAWAGAAGALAFPASAGPNATAIVLGLGAVALTRRAPGGAGALAGAAGLFRPELGLAAALGAAIAVG